MEQNVLAVAYGNNGKRWQTLLTPQAAPASFAIETASEFASAIAIDDNNIIVSYANGTVEGPAVEYQQLNLSYAMPLAGETWLGGRTDNLVSARGPQPGRGRSEFQTGGGTRANAQAAERALVGLWVKGHPIAVGYKHTAIWITPRDPKVRKEHPAIFTNEYSDPRDRGVFFATLGGGPVPDGCGGLLVSAYNRGRDISVPPDTPEEFERLAYPEARENELIAAIIAAEAAYGDNLQYECWPDSGTEEYNSNSVVAGLLRAVGIQLPRFPQQMRTTFGYLRYYAFDKPVPPQRFRGQQ